jgi:hypothetical protein
VGAVSDDLLRDAHDAGEKAYRETLEGEMEGHGCACETCLVREVLVAAWPLMRKAALEGYPE